MITEAKGLLKRNLLETTAEAVFTLIAVRRTLLENIDNIYLFFFYGNNIPAGPMTT